MQSRAHNGDPSRFYQLILQEDLLGGWSVVRQWGRMGNRGAFRKEHFDSLGSAQEAVVNYRDRQLKKGFAVMFIHGDQH